MRIPLFSHVAFLRLSTSAGHKDAAPLCCIFSRLALVDPLLEHGADIDAKDKVSDGPAAFPQINANVLLALMLVPTSSVHHKPYAHRICGAAYVLCACVLTALLASSLCGCRMVGRHYTCRATIIEMIWRCCWCNEAPTLPY